MVVVWTRTFASAQHSSYINFLNIIYIERYQMSIYIYTKGGIEEMCMHAWSEHDGFLLFLWQCDTF